MGGSSLTAPDDMALRLRDRFAPSRPSSANGGGGGTPVIGVYGREAGVEWDANDETCNSMTNAWVASVSFTMFVRSEDESEWSMPYSLMAFDICMTV